MFVTTSFKEISAGSVIVTVFTRLVFGDTVKLLWLHPTVSVTTNP